MDVEGRTRGNAESNNGHVSRSSTLRCLSFRLCGIQKAGSGAVETSFLSTGVDIKLMSGVGMMPCVRRCRLAFDRTANFLLQLCTGHVNAVVGQQACVSKKIARIGMCTYASHPSEHSCGLQVRSVVETTFCRSGTDASWVF